MKKLTYLRFLTYGMLLAIASLSSDVRRFIEVSFEPREYPPVIKSLDTSTWRGEKERSLTILLHDARRFSDTSIIPPFSEMPLGVKKLLEQQSPGYQEPVRRVRWVVSAPGFVVRTYEVYFYITGKEWIVLDVATWEDQFTA